MLAAQLWPDVLSAVGTAPDPRKGERLVLLTQKKGATRGEFAAPIQFESGCSADWDHSTKDDPWPPPSD